jgi:hypothetical protein
MVVVEELTHLHEGTAAHETASAYVPSRRKVSDLTMMVDRFERELRQKGKGAKCKILSQCQEGALW